MGYFCCCFFLTFRNSHHIAPQLGVWEPEAQSSSWAPPTASGLWVFPRAARPCPTALRYLRRSSPGGITSNTKSRRWFCHFWMPYSIRGLCSWVASQKPSSTLSSFGFFVLPRCIVLACGRQWPSLCFKFLSYCWVASDKNNSQWCW